jgi:hypothetical protein
MPAPRTPLANAWRALASAVVAWAVSVGLWRAWENALGPNAGAWMILGLLSLLALGYAGFTIILITTVRAAMLSLEGIRNGPSLARVVGTFALVLHVALLGVAVWATWGGGLDALS